MIAPSNNFLRLGFAATAVLGIFGLSRLFHPEFAAYGIVLLIACKLLVALALVDWLISRPLYFLKIKRQINETLPVGKPSKVVLRLLNPCSFTADIKIFDHHPSSFKVQNEPAKLAIKPNEEVAVIYYVIPTKRGDAEFTEVDLRAKSRLGLWTFKIKIALNKTVKIYPDFSAIAQLAGLEHDQQSAQIGLHIQQRRGEGMEFRQLRDFRKGDGLRRVDWKASSRMGKLIARDYQDERDQEIIFMLDCGRRLHTKDGDISHFDHCLNAVLLTAYVALNKGDRVGLMTFAGNELWFPPRGGESALPAMIRQVYDLHSSFQNPDYLTAASKLLQHQKRRALVVMLSNFHSEEDEDLVAAAQLLRRRHLLISASLRETYVDQRLEKPVESFNDALEYSGASQFMSNRTRLVNQMRSLGIYIIDTSPKEMPIQLVNQYLAMKKAGLC